MSEKPEDYLKRKKFEYKRENDELICECCPFCGDDKGHFSIHSKMGVWQCFKCGEKGNLFTLKRALGDLDSVSKVTEVWGDDVTYDLVSSDEVDGPHQALLDDQSTLQWLYARHFGPDIIAKWKLGVSVTGEGRWLNIPYYKEGVCVNIKFRALPPQSKSFRWKPKHETPLFGIDDVKDFDDIIIFEGEMDLIAARGMGYHNSIGLPNGADGFKSEHWDTLVKKRKIYLVLDPDNAGRKGANSLSTRLGADRCFDVRIPNNMDANELLVKFGWEEGKKRLDACLSDAKAFGQGDVSSVGAALDQLRQRIDRSGVVEEGYVSPWASLTRILGPISGGEVILLQAIPKTGKTSLAQQWLQWLAKQYGVPTMLYCLEMPLWRLAQSLVANRRLRRRDNLTAIDVRITQAEMLGVPFYYGMKPNEWTFERVKDTITYAVQRFGIKFVCFDNLQLLCRSGDDTFKEQAQASAGFKQLASTLDIAILLVVQPRKVSQNSSPGLYDPSGSASQIADADGMVTMWRRPLHATDEVVTEQDLSSRNEEYESFGPEVLVRVPGSRYRSGGQVVLQFAGEYATFTETPLPEQPEFIVPSQNSEGTS